MCEQHKKKKNNLEDWCKENGREDILKEWDTKKNREQLGIEIEEVSAGMGKKVWWLCKEGHSYKQTIASKTNGNGCPYCSGNKVLKGFNDLATTHPELEEEWDTEKNRGLLGLEIEEVSSGSNKKVWWLCKEGHSYKQLIVNKTKGIGCPYCSGRYPIVGGTDLATTNPEILKYWDYTKNKIKPEEISKGSNKRVWWLCLDNPEHSFQKKIQQMVKFQSCPICRKEKRNSK